MIVGAAIVDVLPHLAAGNPTPNPFSGDRLAAVGAAQQPAAERKLGRSGAAILPLQDFLAGLEGGATDEQPIAALVDLAAAM